MSNILSAAQGPEYPYPHGSTDAHDIVKHVISAYGTTYDLSNLTVGGFSAGGGLAVGLATSDDEIVEKSIKAVVGVYPWIDISFTLHTPSKVLHLREVVASYYLN